MRTQKSLERMETRLFEAVKKKRAIIRGTSVPPYLRGKELSISSSPEKNQSDTYEGHFLINSGHTTAFFDGRFAMSDPEIKARVAAIARRKMEERRILRNGIPEFDFIIGPARGANAVGEAIQSILKGSVKVSESYPPKNVDGNFDFTYPFNGPRQVRTLLVDDAATSFGSVKKIMAATYEAERLANIRFRRRKSTMRREVAGFLFIGGFMVALRVSNLTQFLLNTITMPFDYAFRMECETWPADQCPLCPLHVPLYKI